MKKKNSFLTFCFAMMPGAGQMYLGLMKKGTSIMSLFFGVIATAMVLDFPWLMFILPVLWFYAFFDAINYNNMPYEEKEFVEDKFLFDDRELRFLVTNNKTLVGIICIILGSCVIYNNIISQLLSIIHNSFFRQLLREMPTILIAAFIILFGIGLVKSKDYKETDYKEFKGTNKEDK